MFIRRYRLFIIILSMSVLCMVRIFICYLTDSDTLCNEKSGSQMPVQLLPSAHLESKHLLLDARPSEGAVDYINRKAALEHFIGTISSKEQLHLRINDSIKQTIDQNQNSIRQNLKISHLGEHRNSLEMTDNQKNRIIKERRRIQEETRKAMQVKIRFEQEVSSVVKDLERSGIVEVRKKPVIGQPASVDPNHWQGLNSTELRERFPGIVLSSDYVLGRRFVDPKDPSAAGMQGQPHSIEDMTDGQVEERFYQLITLAHLDCLLIKRMGSFDDGGWDLCTVEPYNFNPGCIVYSFGINFDFTFDDAMATAFDCTVISFDPSMAVNDYVRSANVQFYQLGIGPDDTITHNGWRLLTLKSIQARLHHEQKIIDVIKLDIEYSEWVCLRQMLSDGSLNNVKQLIFEMHTSEVETVQRPSSKEDFLDMFLTLTALEQIGFRRYHYHYNPFGHYTSVRTGKMRSCCYELYYINIKFIE